MTKRPGRLPKPIKLKGEGLSASELIIADRGPKGVTCPACGNFHELTAGWIVKLQTVCERCGAPFRGYGADDADLD
jgi:uncharacterized protein (DUF983 family)